MSFPGARGTTFTAGWAGLLEGTAPPSPPLATCPQNGGNVQVIISLNATQSPAPDTAKRLASPAAQETAGGDVLQL